MDGTPGFDPREVPATTLAVGVHSRIEEGTAFVVLRGRAMIESEDQDAVVFVRRGSICRLPSASMTRWAVSETIEYLPVTEASFVFKQHADEPTDTSAGDGRVRSIRPFRPRRHVS